MSLLENFIKYIKVDTQSSEEGSSNPTTNKQFDLGNLLVEQLHQLGLSNAFIDEKCYVYAYLPSNTQCDRTIALIAHLDTSSEMTGTNVKPKIIEQYDGKDIILNDALNIVMKVNDFPYLKELKGQTIITTDGTTLLGADDKAGIAIIMEIITQIMSNNILHPNIIITFTPDEEVGMGTNGFNYQYYQDHNCTMAYTFDGDEIDTINFENFNAASVKIVVRGKSIHPGSAKNKMVNSMHLAMEFHQMLPVDMVPSKTEKYEGFNHLTDFSGTVEKTILHYIIRNHDMKKFEEQIEFFKNITTFLNQKYGENTFETTITNSYYNMRDLVLANPQVLEYAIKGLQREGIEPKLEPIRGGTDGARLSFMGIITPNLGTGGGNYHGKYEYVSLDGMQKMVKIGLQILRIITE